MAHDKICNLHKCAFLGSEQHVLSSKRPLDMVAWYIVDALIGAGMVPESSFDGGVMQMTIEAEMRLRGVKVD